MQIKYRGKTFQSAEAAYSHTKAVFMGDLNAASRILEANSALQTKRIRSRIKTNDEWKRMKPHPLRESMSQFILPIDVDNDLINTLQSAGAV